MTTKTYSQFQTRQTQQNEAIFGQNQVQNNAGGFVFTLDMWKQLERFLILGSEGGTYYVSEQKLTTENASNVLACIKADGQRVVKTILEISDSGRAPKNDPALFALALVASFGTDEARIAAFSVLPRVARIGTHLFHFVQYATQFRGWGRGLRSAVGSWYTGKSPINLAKQVTKYAQRDGWSHRDLLRLTHVIPTNDEYAAVFEYIVKGTITSRINAETLQSDAVNYLAVVDAIKSGPIEGLTELIDEFELPREVLPTDALTRPEVWEALLPHMGLTAMIRNLGTMSKVGLLTPMSSAEKVVICKLEDVDALKRERVHPLAILLAQSVYGSGHGIRGSATWDVNRKVSDALNEAFYAAFQTIVPTGKRILLALDVSGSMAGGEVAGTPLTPREAVAAMAMVTARSEKNYGVMAFSHSFMPLDISPRDSLDSIVRKTSNLPFAGTDCALPMEWATKGNVQVDAFVIYTDNETWAGNIHPVQALAKYRKQSGINATLTVVGMTATEFTIADPSDAGMLDVVGFDSAAPSVIADFIRG